MGEIQTVCVVATPTSKLLGPLIHDLSHHPNLNTTILTRQTSINLTPAPHSHDHDHNHHAHSNFNILHSRIEFTPSSLAQHLTDKDAVICIFSGSDLHLSSIVVDAAISTNVKLFIPSEFGLDTSSPKIRELLPPYQTRLEVQERLKRGNMKWTAIYSGIMIEDGLKTDGVLGIDVMWGSVTVFPDTDILEIAISTYEDVAKEILSSLTGTDHGQETTTYTSTFTVTLNDLIRVVEQELNKKLDCYEADPDAARKEATERMKMGYFDGGVALMGKVAVWATGPETWTKWEKNNGCKDWKGIVAKMAKRIRNGDIGGDGCGC